MEEYFQISTSSNDQAGRKKNSRRRSRVDSTKINKVEDV
jgi:hypothetical protein